MGEGAIAARSDAARLPLVLGGLALLLLSVVLGIGGPAWIAGLVLVVVGVALFVLRRGRLVAAAALVVAVVIAGAAVALPGWVTGRAAAGAVA